MSKLKEIARIRHRDIELLNSTFSDSNHAIDHFNFLYQKIEKDYGKPINLYEAITHHFVAREEQTLFAASEFKRASPSKGDINNSSEIDFAASQALKYAAGNTNMVSVLTEKKHFKGSLLDMLNIRVALEQAGYRDNFNKKKVLVLRKDFIVDKIQLYQARAYGADTVLLIVAILKEDILMSLVRCSRELGMEPLVEVANSDELMIALRVGAKVVGVNNRNLHTFELDLKTSINIAKEAKSKGVLCKLDSLEGISSGVFILALSGIKAREDVELYETSGNIAGVLIGESLMRDPSPTKLLERLLMNNVSHASSRSLCFTKICGLISVDDARYCAEQGSEFIGVIFAPKSKRMISVDTAKDIVNEIRAFREYRGKLFPRGRETTQQSFLKEIGRRKPIIVGVFQDQDINEINRIVLETGVDVVQLHDTLVCPSREEKIQAPVIRVLHIQPGSAHTYNENDIRKGKNFAYLLDTAVGKSSGGTGKKFDWKLIDTFYKCYSVINNTTETPLVFLAGGITPENVSKAVRVNDKILCVDVASGVEVKNSPGIKNRTAINNFIRRAHSACNG